MPMPGAMLQHHLAQPEVPWTRLWNVFHGLGCVSLLPDDVAAWLPAWASSLVTFAYLCDGPASRSHLFSCVLYRFGLGGTSGWRCSAELSSDQWSLWT